MIIVTIEEINKNGFFKMVDKACPQRTKNVVESKTWLTFQKHANNVVK